MIRKPFLMIAAAAALFLAFRKRPIKPPQQAGSWEPAAFEN
jgi:hypothetical protein